MKYACNKCLKVTEETEVKGWLEVTIRGSSAKGRGQKILLCPECKLDFWKSVCSGFGSGEEKRGKS